MSRQLRAHQYRLYGLVRERNEVVLDIQADVEAERADIRALQMRIDREFARNPLLFRGYRRS